MIKTKRQSHQTWFIAIVLISFFLRIMGISTRPIWYDEAFSILFARKGVGAMLLGTLTPTGAGTADIHPLGYYSLLWGWMNIFGESLIATRLLSVLAGIGIVILAYKIGTYLFSKNLGLLAAFFVGLAPFQIHYAQEIRMYAFLGFWLLLALYAFLKGIKDSDWRWGIVFSLSATLAQYTHNLAVFFLVPLALTPIFMRKTNMIWAVMKYGSLSLFLYLPWLIHLPAQLDKVQGGYWVTKPGIERLITLLLSYVTNLPLPDNWLLPALLVTFLPISLALWQTFLVLRQKKSRAWRGAWLLYLSFTPPFALFIVSQWIPVFIERALMPSGAIFCIWLAWALFETKMPHPVQGILTGFLLISAGMGIYQHLNYAGFPYAPYQEMTESLDSRQQFGDIIVHSNKLTALPAIYYAPELSQEYLADISGSSTDTLALATQETLGLFAKPNLPSATEGAKRIWFIIFQKSLNEYQQAGIETHPHLAWLDENYTLEKIEFWEDIKIYLYSQ
ncbi:MAG: hypothetical protein DRI32_05605 [Chloroflexi bacterium]|nr:MAG: hypothetical protein DRI32_05605 [Chloroflexota bacterium]